LLFNLAYFLICAFYSQSKVVSMWSLLCWLVLQIELFLESQQGWKKKLNSSLPLGQVALKFCLPGLVFICSFNDTVDRRLPDPLPIRQIRIKSYLPRGKIYLSQTTRRHVLGALHRYNFFAAHFFLETAFYVETTVLLRFMGWHFMNSSQTIEIISSWVFLCCETCSKHWRIPC